RYERRCAGRFARPALCPMFRRSACAGPRGPWRIAPLVAINRRRIAMSKSAVSPSVSENKAIERTAPVETTVQRRGQELAQRQQPGWTFSPSIDVWDAGSEWVLVADVPGADHESIEITCEDRVLTLRAEVQPRMPEDAPG